MIHKCLTVHQPFASLIIHGIKDVENRSRRIHYRGPLLIHAGKQWSTDGFDKLLEYANNDTRKWDLRLIQTLCHAKAWRGAIIGQVELVGCIWPSDSEWAELAGGMWHWLLENPQSFDEPIPMRGRQGLWQITEAELEAARKGVAG